MDFPSLSIQNEFGIPVRMKQLEDKIAIVTGGSQGIGKAIVQQFLDQGAKVAIWDIDTEKAEATKAELGASDAQLKIYQVNVAEWEAVEASMKATHADFGRIDILINNAGITRDASMKKMSLEQWNQVIQVNLNGVFYCVRAAFPIMAAQHYGRIVNASSVVGIQGNFGQTNYVATKAGVIGMTKVWAREFGRKGITVNAVAPGFINTEMMSTIPEKVLDNIKGKSPLNRLGEVDEVASVYTFLASTISVDGGVSL